MAKKAVVVIPQTGFSDQELATVRRILADRGVETLIASRTRAIARSLSGREIQPDLALPEIEAKDFAALVFVCGPEAVDYFNDPAAFQLVHDFRRAGKVIAASALGPSILANAGALISKTATASPSEEQILVNHGALYTGMEVEVDGQVVTARDPLAAKKFSEQLAYLLEA